MRPFLGGVRSIAFLVLGVALWGAFCWIVSSPLGFAFVSPKGAPPSVYFAGYQYTAVRPRPTLGSGLPPAAIPGDGQALVGPTSFEPPPRGLTSSKASPKGKLPGLRHKVASKRVYTRALRRTDAAALASLEVGLEFEELFASEYRPLAGAMYLLTGDRGEAEDLAQDAMARVLERWDRVGKMASPKGYVYRTALNLHRKRLRRSRLVPIAVGPMREENDPTEAMDRRLAIKEALRSLSREQQEAIVLVEWLGLDAGGAAAVLGISAESVRARVHRAKTRLIKQLEGDSDE
jgi:RNA polymerase sigma factor (sigma-70 family)